MSKLDKNSNKDDVSSEELSRAEKKRLRAAAMADPDTLALDERHKKPGMVYRLCNVTPGNIERYKAMGYEVTQNQIHSGKGGLGEASTAKGSVEVEVGRTNSMKAVWMETPEENYEILRELQAEAAARQDEMMYESEIPDEHRTGSIKTKFST